jgi:hypothetical protein
MNNSPLGARLWNLACHNHHLVHEIFFWEINNGKDSLFWEDTWKQLPRLVDQPSLLRLQPGMTSQNKSRVAQYWMEEENPSHWRKWIPYHGWTGETHKNIIEGFLEVLSKRRICIFKK